MWTPKVEEEFRLKLTHAAHHPSVHDNDGFLFGEGDVNILVARPWYGDEMDDEDWNDDDNANTNANAEDKSGDDRKALGVQLILQISIYNPKAILQRQNPENQGRGRILLQEVGIVWSNFTKVFRRSKATSVCDPFDLYPLAKTANLVADKILASPKFLSLLVAENDDGDINGNSNGDDNTQEVLPAFHSAKLVSSWTIGTQIYDDYVNYLGPLASTPFFPIVKFLHESLIFILAFWCVICILKSVRLVRVYIVRIVKKWNPDSYQHDPISEDDYDLEDEDSDDSESLSLLAFFSPTKATTDSSGVELTARSYMGSRIKKRITR